MASARPDVEDDAARLDPADGAGDDLRLALRVLAEDLLALDLAQALAHELRGHLGVDAAERRRRRAPRYSTRSPTLASDLYFLASSTVNSMVASSTSSTTWHGAVGVESGRSRDRRRRRRSRCRARRGGRPTGWRPRACDELLARDVLLGIQLKERADEIAVHVCASFRLLRLPPLRPSSPGSRTNKRGGHPRSEAARVL